MEFLERIKQLGEKAQVQKELLQTEEASKNALVMPFIMAMGYDVFNPHEVVPEYVADIGTKRNEKVDYVLMAQGVPRIIIECKKANSSLADESKNQLKRYFSVLSDVQFAILTNGILYQFYSDIDADNIMDEDPFLEINLLQVQESAVESLKNFSKNHFSPSNALDTATRLKYRIQIKSELAAEYKKPSADFVRLCIKNLHDGPKTQNVLDKFTPIVRDAFHQLINDEVSDRLKLIFEGKDQEQTEDAVEGEALEESPSADQASKESRIITTEEELEAFDLIRELLSEQIEPQRIAMRDRISYCGILLDDNNRKSICRLYLDQNQKVIGIWDIIDDQKVEVKHPIDSVENIREHKEALLAACALYM